MVPNLLVHHSSLPWCSESSPLHASSQVSAGLVEERGEVGEVVLGQLLPKRTGDLLLIDEAGNLSCSLIEEAVSHLDQVEEIAEVGAEMCASRCTCHCLGSLRETSVKHGKDFWLEDSLLDVEEAGGGRSPLRAEEVQGTLGALAGGNPGVGAQVLAHPVLPVSLTAWHV